MNPSSTHTFEVRKDNWRETRIVESPLDQELADRELLLRVDRLALTANNISYAATGDSLGYWGFFPAESGWGRIPAMGWSEVVTSKHPDIAVGERLWGWFPFSTHLKVQAGHVSATNLTDASPHRASYAEVYARLDRASANPFYDLNREDHDSLLRGLFTTSWLVEDFLAVNDSFGASACLITSASSKTAIALGHCVQQNETLTGIGITSPGNVAFCQELGCYDQVLSYDQVAELDPSRAVVMVDMAGSAQVISDLHHHYRDNMKHSCRIGATHYQEAGPVDDLPGASPEFFFAPAHVKTRSAQLGPAQYLAELAKAYVGFRQASDRWLTIQRHFGADAVSRVYQSVLSGNADPDTGHILSLWTDGVEAG
ncbi:MAG: DUF2855 family protein [Xanthomonadales bacterium]|nr:DUF2855 family protein [Xanthomonadales bacterium]